MEEGMKRPAPRPKTLPLTPDPFSSMTVTPSPVENAEFERRHVIEVLREHGNTLRLGDILRQSVAEELFKIGVDYDVVKKSSKARKSPRHKDPSKTDGNNGLHRSTEVQLSCGAMVTIPLIVKTTCDFIRQNIKQQGIFRISGLASRANGIMHRFMNPEIEDFFAVCDTVHDVASVLKQYLRQLEVSLIPHAIQNVFIQCLDLQPVSVRTNALILATCLVPSETIGCLSYILQFLAEAAKSCQENLMTFENLSIIMGLNIMPIDPRKNDKAKDIQKTERHTLDLHNKVIEILMKNADRVGEMTPEIEKRLDSLLTLRSSEDELENEGVGRRKKRRSGSLNRVLGFIKKVTGKNGSETPITPMMLHRTPGGDSFSHTPIIKGSAKRTDDGTFSLKKKNYFFDGVRKSTKNEIGTPSTPLPSKITCPSPAVCLDPSPMRIDWKQQTPNGNRLKNFVTPALLRRREKSVDSDKSVFSAPPKPSKPKIRFGRNKPTKKGTPQQDPELLKSKQISESTISIHKLTNSPRAATLQRNTSSTRIKPAVPQKRFSSSTLKLRNHSKSSLKSLNGEGDYVTLSSTAGLDDTDVRNNAFIASSISILTDSSEVAQLTNQNAIDFDSKLYMSEESVDFPPTLQFKLSPLIREIDSLTKTTNELTLSTLRGKSTLSFKRSTESPTEMDTTPISAHQVETKFIRALKESKVIEIQSNAKNLELPINNLQRRLSIQDRRSRISMSPSQRKITSARRRTHEIGRVTSVVTPTRFYSLRSPRQNPSPTAGDKNSLRRSPSTRCTLRRGRPNTTRAGLARPSPVRNTPHSQVTSPLSPVPSTSSGKNIQEPPPLPPRRDMNMDATIATPSTLIRSMSSVQELVNKLEINKKQSKSISEVAAPEDSIECTTTPQIQIPVITRSKTMKKLDKYSTKMPPLIFGPQQAATCEEINWIAGHNLQFDRKDFHGLIKKKCDRDSIHYLNTLAGKVPATVEFFNKIGHNKSPAKSLIPRYTALHDNNSKSNTPSPLLFKDEVAPGVNDQGAATTPSRISRRISSADIDIRNKHEELLESIKKDRVIKRSATIAGTYKNQNVRRNETSVEESTRVSNFKRPNTLNLNKALSPTKSSNRSTGLASKPPSFRRITQTTRILEEDESAVVLSASPKYKHSKKPVSTTTSPLKTSNVANFSLQSSSRDASKKSPSAKLSPPLRGAGAGYNLRKRNENITISRTTSESGTKATTTAPSTTPKIKKAFTTRAYDMMNSTTSTPLTPKNTQSVVTTKTTNSSSHSHARHCPTITPRRRVPRMGNGGNNSESLSKTRTPLRATNIFTPSRC